MIHLLVIPDNVVFPASIHQLLTVNGENGEPGRVFLLQGCGGTKTKIQILGSQPEIKKKALDSPEIVLGPKNKLTMIIMAGFFPLGARDWRSFGHRRRCGWHQLGITSCQSCKIKTHNYIFFSTNMKHYKHRDANTFMVKKRESNQKLRKKMRQCNIKQCDEGLCYMINK